MIYIKTEEEIEIMKKGGEILAEILRKLSQEVKVGIKTWDLEERARQLTSEYPGASPAFLSYEDYPATLCVSINDEVVHALPSDRMIEPGDLVSLDFGLIYRGFNVDSAVTILIPGGEQQELKKKLLRTTKECLEIGISKAKAGNTIGDIGSAIQKHAEKNRFGIIRELVGHGIGKELHEEPHVPNFGKEGQGPELVEGMVIAIEPMFTTGSIEVKEDKKTLAWKTKDGSLSVHFEHTVAITKDRPIVLTKQGIDDIM